MEPKRLSPFQSPPDHRPLCRFDSGGKCQNCGRLKPGRPDQKVYAHCRPSPASSRQEPPIKPPLPQAGPGTELKKLLSRIGITSTPTCKCNARAREMDARGCDWCVENIETVSAWLEEEAKRRGLIYSRIAGKALVLLAVRRARKAMPDPGAAQT